MKSTLGAPSFARNGEGHAGSDSPTVRPMRPVKAVPDLYSFNAMSTSPLGLDSIHTGALSTGDAPGQITCGELIASPYIRRGLMGNRMKLSGGSVMYLQPSPCQEETISHDLLARRIRPPAR